MAFATVCHSFGDVRIAVMISQSKEANNVALASFLQTIIGRSQRTAIFTYDLNGQKETGQKVAQDIQKIKPDLVLAIGTIAAISAKEELKNIPIVFCMVLNPVSSGLVRSMNSPGGSITGASLDIPIETQFRYMQSVIGNLKTIGVLYNPEETGAIVQQADRKARLMGISIYAKPISSEREVPAALKGLMGHVDALWSVADTTVFSTTQSAQYILLNTLRTGTPFMGLSPSFVSAGALMCLSCDYEDIGKQAAELAERILKGEKAGNIPVAMPRKVLLSLNLRTADQIGLRIPDKVIKSADEVIR
jgi:putative ABC transport system substrate-binding protein